MPEGPELNWEQLNKLTEEVIAEDGPRSASWQAETSHTKAFNDHFIETFRANGGVIPGELGDVDMVLVTARGAKTGRPRTIPLSYHPLEGSLYVVASMGGAAKNPPWYYNIKANPDVTVEIGTETFAATAIEVKGADRDRIYAGVVERLPVFADYEKRTGRSIPIIELRRAR